MELLKTITEQEENRLNLLPLSVFKQGYKPLNYYKLVQNFLIKDFDINKIYYNDSNGFEIIKVEGLKPISFIIDLVLVENKVYLYQIKDLFKKYSLSLNRQESKNLKLLKVFDLNEVDQ